MSLCKKLLILCLVMLSNFALAQDTPPEEVVDALQSADIVEVDTALRHIQDEYYPWSESYAPVLRKLADTSESARVRLVATQVLFAHDGSDALLRQWVTLLSQVDAENSANLESMVLLYDLTQAQKEFILPSLVQVIQDPDRSTLATSILAWAFDSLGAGVSEGARKQFDAAALAAASSSDPMLRSRAILLLGTLPITPERTAIFEKGLTDESPMVATAAVESLYGQTKSLEKVRPGLLNLLAQAEGGDPDDPALRYFNSPDLLELQAFAVKLLLAQMSSDPDGAAPLLARTLLTSDQVPAAVFQKVLEISPSESRVRLLGLVSSESLEDKEFLAALRSMAKSSGPESLQAASILYLQSGDTVTLSRVLASGLSATSPLAADSLLMLRSFPQLLPPLRAEVLALTQSEVDDEVQNAAFRTLLAEKPAEPTTLEAVKRALLAHDYIPLGGLYGAQSSDEFHRLRPADFDQALIWKEFESLLADKKIPFDKKHAGIVALLYLLDPLSLTPEQAAIVADPTNYGDDILGGMRAPLAMDRITIERRAQIWSHDCNGKKLRLRLSVVPTFQTVYTSLYLDYGSTSQEFSEESDFSPYSSDLYENATKDFFDLKEESVTYQDSPYPLPRVVIHLDPSRFTSKDFQAIAQCLRENAPVIQKAILDLPARQEHIAPFKIAGVVLGRYESFIQTFTRNPAQSIEVYPNGSTALVERNQSSVSWSLLGRVLTGEGKPRLQLDGDQVDFSLFSDSKGRRFGEVFEIELRPLRPDDEEE